MVCLKNKKVLKIVAIVVVVFLVIVGICYVVAPPTAENTKQPVSSSSVDEAAPIEYSVNDTKQTYVRDGKECMGYRVVVPSDATEGDLLTVFNEVVSGDGYPMHTVWFYSSEDLATGGDMYDVAMLEESSEGAAPTVTMA